VNRDRRALLLAEDPWPDVAYDRGRKTLPGGPGIGPTRNPA
jgi:hypothetical protein